jgi:hypothetical protein
MNCLLTPIELAELTGKKRHKAQARELDKLRIPYRVRSNGSLIVLREYAYATPQAQPTPPAVRLLPPRGVPLRQQGKMDSARGRSRDRAR